MANPPLTPEARPRLLRLVTLLALVLMAAGVVVLTCLPRLPVPLRMMAGLGDIFIGLVLLVMVRQQHQPGAARTAQPDHAAPPAPETPNAKPQTPKKLPAPSSES